MLKGYKYRLHPTPAQAELLIKTIGCAQFIYNKLLEDRIAIREEAKAGIVTRRKPATPASYKPLFPFLAEAGKFFISILVEQDDEPWIPAENKVGIDLGLDHFAVMMNDAMVSEKIENPRFLRQSEAKVKKAQRALSRKKIGSKNREKAKLLLAKKHEKIANQRQDFLHKLSRRIVDENQVIVVETLTSKDMMKNHKVAKSIGDVSWYEFVRQLEYKCTFYGRTLIKADPWYASTQICSTCGVKGEKKTMDVREWTCTHCGAYHDRDINASLSLLMLAD
ncbi:RNA-guided endonuclease TnpB family protein [Exiguobacterium sp. TRN 1102]|uniref:RNA-guided endonuclease TnpB family protein n=2 Tax=unclassified Exiguobacterium TaxID=2644629 RepID=UPI003D77BB4D